MKFDLQKGSRTRLLAIVVIIIAAVFVARLFYLQVFQYGHYVELARATQERRFVIPAQRGEIYAKDGETPVRLVMNQTVYTVFADPETVTEHDQIAKTLREVAGGNLEPDLDTRLHADNRYQRLATKLTATQRDKIKEKNYYGIGFQAESQRVYLEGQLAAQVLGYVNNDGQGNYGIEGYMDEELRGKDGMLQAVTDVRDVPLTIGRDNIRTDAEDGKSPVLSIDRNIQSKVEQTLREATERTGATNASAVVLNPNTGKVMAMANYPSFNPAEFNKVEDVSYFNNDTISLPYEPGSTVKAFTMATAIDRNVARASDTYTNTDYITVDDRTISNATKGQTGVITFQTAMQWSLNTGFVTLAQRLGNGTEITRGARDIMYSYFHDRLLLGQRTGIELANEAPGLLVSPEEALGNAVRYSNMSFGQGMETTMIQVAGGFSALVNGGTYYQPTIIDGYMVDGQYKSEQKDPVSEGAVSANTSQQIVAMLSEARRSGFPGADKGGYLVGGKTGTSQVIRDGVYSDRETIGSYIGFGGSDKPEYVIMVKVSGKDKELQGARDAMPIFTDISNWMIDYLTLRPRG
jgi:cell division protein FtsI/penicillin-binding protein 2